MSSCDVKILVFTNMYPFPEMPYYGSFVKDEVEALRARGCDVDVLFVNGIANKLNYFGAPLRFIRQLKKKHYDIIHSHHSFCSFIACMQKKLPVVWTFHEGEIASGEDVIRKDAFIKRLAYSKSFKRKVAARVDTIITVASHFKKPLGRFDAITLPSGVDTKLFCEIEREKARRELDLDESKHYVLFPSSPKRPEKRFELAKAAVGLAKDEAGDVEIITLEDVPHERVPLYMNACNLTLMTSAFEASPVTIRESLACNVPVVCTDVGDAREIIEQVDGCAVVDPDPQEIAAAVSSCLLNHPRVEGRGVAEKYSLEKTAEKLVEIYRDVIRKRKR